MRLDRLTKRLLRRLRPEEIAIIAHRDLDELAAKGLLRARVKAVINAYPSISGRYPNRGPERLLQARIPIIDNVGEDIFNRLAEGDRISIRGPCIFQDNRLIARGEVLDYNTVRLRLEEGRANLARELDRFINNTLVYAAREKEV